MADSEEVAAVQPSSKQPSLVIKIKEWMRLRVRSTDERQLDALRTTFAGRLYRRAKSARQAGTTLGTWGEAADLLLSEAEVALRRYNFDTAWACYYEATRMEIFAYSPDELTAAKTALQTEAAEAGAEESWRNAAIRRLLAGPDELFAARLGKLVPDVAVRDKIDALLAGARRDEETLEHVAGLLDDAQIARPHETARAIHRLADERNQSVRTALYAASTLRDEDGTHEAGRIVRIRRQLLVLGGVLVGILVALLLLATATPVDLQGLPATTGESLWVHVALFGALGGGLSAFRALSSRVSRQRMPKHLVSGLLTAIRPLLGAIPALAAYVVLESGVLGFKPSTTAAVLGVAFIAGFTERLIVRAVESPRLPEPDEGPQKAASKRGQVPAPPVVGVANGSKEILKTP
ncbi:MAG: hypothetical protein ACRD0K_25865 [Egibacteraceae bacterium]